MTLKVGDSVRVNDRGEGNDCRECAGRIGRIESIAADGEVFIDIVGCSLKAQWLTRVAQPGDMLLRGSDAAKLRHLVLSYLCTVEGEWGESNPVLNAAVARFVGAWDILGDGPVDDPVVDDAFLAVGDVDAAKARLEELRRALAQAATTAAARVLVPGEPGVVVTVGDGEAVRTRDGEEVDRVPLQRFVAAHPKGGVYSEEKDADGNIVLVDDAPISREASDIILARRASAAASLARPDEARLPAVSSIVSVPTVSSIVLYRLPDGFGPAPCWRAAVVVSARGHGAASLNVLLDHDDDWTEESRAALERVLGDGVAFAPDTGIPLVPPRAPGILRLRNVPHGDAVGCWRWPS